MDRRLLWTWLSLACGPASRVAIRLLCEFDTPEKIYKANRRDIAALLHDREMKVLNHLDNKDLSDASAILRRCDSAGIRILTPDDAAYPRSLYPLRDAPIVLYCLGHLPNFDTLCACAVVGTRKMSDYGKTVAYELGRGLGAAGTVLVSGLALGIDGMAMAGAMDEGATTIGVLGCGIDIVYPPEHKHLMKRVIERGAIITEYPPGTPPTGSNFPVRNRIISGLSQAVIVVEGDSHSGALITAKKALYQGRDLYAVPGMIGQPGAEGTNQLIKSGAHAITSALDVLENYEFIYPHSINMKNAELALRNKVSADTVTDVGRRPRADESVRSFEGKGLHGGKMTAEIGKKRISPKKMVACFTEQDEKRPTPPAKGKKTDVVVAKRVDFELLGENEKRIYEAMTPDVPMISDDIHVSGLTIAEIMAGLTILELSGVVECGAGGYYMRVRMDGDLTDDAKE